MNYLEDSQHEDDVPTFMARSFHDEAGNLCVQMKVLEGEHKGVIFLVRAYKDNIMQFSLLEDPNEDTEDEIDEGNLEYICSRMFEKLVDQFPEKPH